MSLNTVTQRSKPGLSLFALLLSACGARTGLEGPREVSLPDVSEVGVDAMEEPSPDVLEEPDVVDVLDAEIFEEPDVIIVSETGCTTDQACSDGVFCNGIERCVEGVCIAGTPACENRDPCVMVSCDEGAQRCVSNPATPDNDGDGHRAPLPGTRPGAPGSCGDDCDDNDRTVFPGAMERCNGRDDNCNAQVDEGTVFTPVGSDVQVSDNNVERAVPSGIVWTGDRYLATYSGNVSGGNSRVLSAELDAAGTRIGMPQQRIQTTAPNDAFGGATAWSGRVIGIVWSDRRNDDYEVYFNRLNTRGEKLGPDARITFGEGFSIAPTIAWTGADFVLVWQDERRLTTPGPFNIFAQRADELGRQLGENIQLTTNGLANESPSVAVGPDGEVGIAWLSSRMNEPVTSRAINFMTRGLGLTPLGAPRTLWSAGRVPGFAQASWALDRYVITWYDDADNSADHEIWGAVAGRRNEPLVAARALSMDVGFSRYPWVVPFYDRLVLVWADDRATMGMQGYDLWARALNADLTPFDREQQLTRTPRDSTWPIATRGPDTDIGVLFRSNRAGRWQVRFLRMRCEAR